MSDEEPTDADYGRYWDTVRALSGPSTDDIILTCPCCGGFAYAHEVGPLSGIGVVMWIECEDCGLQIDRHANTEDPRQALRELMAAWNRRDAKATGIEGAPHE